MIGKTKESQILEESENSFTFTVEDVDISKKPPLLSTAQEILTKIIGNGVKYEDSSIRQNTEEAFIPGNIQGFLLALHTAFQYHYPVKLSVSDFILLIGQGLGRHMEKYAEQLRKHFVNHEGKEKIIIRRDEFVMGEQNDWSTIFGEFAEEIKKRIKTDFHSIIVDDTSVATKESRISSEIGLMDSMKAYFKYEVWTLCGIPHITLEGSKEDWENLLSRVKRLQEMNKDNCLLLDFWLKHLVPIVEKICENAITRKPDVEFWTNIYKYQGARGSGSHPTVTGWCTTFLPYLPRRVNPFSNESISTSEIPNQISMCPFVWNYYGKEFPMNLHGGFLGAKYESSTNTIEPVHFWAVSYDNPKGKQEEII